MRIVAAVAVLMLAGLGMACGKDDAGGCNGCETPSGPSIAATPISADIKANGSDGPVTVSSGAAAALSWTSVNANQCIVNPAGFQGTSGTQSTGPLAAAQTYELRCSGPGGRTATDNVRVEVQQVAPSRPAYTTYNLCLGNPSGDANIDNPCLGAEREIPKRADGGYDVNRNTNLKFVLWLWHSAREGCSFTGIIGAGAGGGNTLSDIYERRGAFVSPSPIMARTSYNFPLAGTQSIGITLKNSCDSGRLDQTIPVTVR